VFIIVLVGWVVGMGFAVLLLLLCPWQPSNAMKWGGEATRLDVGEAEIDDVVEGDVWWVALYLWLAPSVQL